MKELNKQERVTVSEDICDKCSMGKQRRCPHAYYYHTDTWGKRLDTPEYCPNKSID